MIASRRSPASRQHPVGPALDRATFVRPIAHRGWHDQGKGRLENTAPAFRAAIDKGYGIECDLQGGGGRHADGVSRPHARPAGGRVGDDRRLFRAQPRPAPLQGPGREDPELRPVPRPGRRTRAAAGRGEAQRRSRARTFSRSIARQADSLQGPHRADVVRSAQSWPRSASSRPSVPRGPVIGGRQLLASLWAGAQPHGARAPPPRACSARRPKASASTPSTIKLVAVARTWMRAARSDLPLFTWTVRTPRQRARAARWADAPIFEGYEA